MSSVSQPSGTQRSLATTFGSIHLGNNDKGTLAASDVFTSQVFRIQNCSTCVSYYVLFEAPQAGMTLDHTWVFHIPPSKKRVPLAACCWMTASTLKPCMPSAQPPAPLTLCAINSSACWCIAVPPTPPPCLICSHQICAVVRIPRVMICSAHCGPWRAIATAWGGHYQTSVCHCRHHA